MDVRAALFSLGTVAGVAYLAVGILGGLFWAPHWEEASTSDQVFWMLFLAGGGILLLGGLRLFRRSPWSAAAMVSVGALAGALALFWTLVVPLVGFALVLLSVVYARRPAATA